MNEGKINAEVISVNPDKVKIMIYSMDDWKTAEEKLKVGSYLEIKDDNSDEDEYVVIAIIDNFKIDLVEITKIDETGQKYIDVERRYILEATPLGSIYDDKFTRGGDTLSIPPKSVSVANENIINKIFSDCINENDRFSFSTLSNNKKIKVSVNGSKFFNERLAIVG